MVQELHPIGHEKSLEYSSAPAGNYVSTCIIQPSVAHRADRHINFIIFMRNVWIWRFTYTVNNGQGLWCVYVDRTIVYFKLCLYLPQFLKRAMLLWHRVFLYRTPREPRISCINVCWSLKCQGNVREHYSAIWNLPLSISPLFILFRILYSA